MLRDGRIDEFAPMPLHPRVRAFFINPHKVAVPCYVSRKDRRQPAWRPLGWMGSIFP